MKNVLIFLFCILLFASCGKHMKITATAEASEKSTKLNVDLSVTEKTKEIDTNIDIPGVHLNVGFNVSDTDCCNDSPDVNSKKVFDTITGTSLTLTYNKKKGDVFAEVEKPAATIPVKMKETSRTQNNITKSEDKEVMLVTKTITNDRKGTAPNWTLIGIVVAVLAAILLFLRFLPFRKKKDKNPLL